MAEILTFERTPPELNAHGQAALLLVESLVHGLIARSLISVADAVDIVDLAADVAVVPENAGDRRTSQTMLLMISKSLRADLR